MPVLKSVRQTSSSIINLMNLSDGGRLLMSLPFSFYYHLIVQSEEQWQSVLCFQKSNALTTVFFQVKVLVPFRV